jgi:hypothetical protein
MDDAAGVWIAVGSGLGDGVGDGVGARVTVSVGVADAVEPEGEALDLGCGDPAAWHATSALGARTRTAPPIPAWTKARWSEVSVRISHQVDTALH